jgi:predicted membrane-bound mannosyltransferase
MLGKLWMGAHLLVQLVAGLLSGVALLLRKIRFSRNALAVGFIFAASALFVYISTATF